MQILDIQKLRILSEPDETTFADRVLEADLLVAGGGMGGCAAALAALRSGRTVVLTEETDWLGGQMTSQGVSALDDHHHIEQTGGARSYYELRRLIREYYQHHARLAPGAASETLNPGGGWVSDLCFEPAAALWALKRLFAPFRHDGRLHLLLRHRAIRAEVDEETVRSVVFRDLDGTERVEVRASFVLDATELGDLLPLTGTEYVIGAESAEETGEPNAADVAAPGRSQSFTYPFALEHRPGEAHSIAEPRDYSLHRERQHFTLRHRYYDARGWVTYRMFETGHDAAGPFWTYRRLVDRSLFEDPAHARDLAMINWPGNDFRHGGLIDVPPEEALASLQAARDLSLGFCYWLQHDCPRDEGGAGYPEFHLREDVMGTVDGLSKFPYIRESRRIRALTTVTEQDISAVTQDGPRARLFPDSAGVGLYAIDIHPAEGEEKIPPAPACPFQIPLGALVPTRMRNLLPACKDIGVTHLTNGAYRLHPVEWNIGEAAALLAVFCLDRKLTPQTVSGDARRLRRFQRRLVKAGIPLYWYTDLADGDPHFLPAQVLAAWGFPLGGAASLTFDAAAPASSEDLRVLSQAAPWARETLTRFLTDWLPRWAELSRGELATAAYEVLSV